LRKTAIDFPTRSVTIRSILALIEKRSLSLSGVTSERPHLTARHASRLHNMFDFNHSQSVDAAILSAPVLVVGEHGCPFSVNSFR
jgi:hypothetical protein